MKHKNNLTPIYWANQQWFLDPRRVLVSKDLHYLIFSDIHIGIYSSFRAQGSYLPTYDQDLLNDTLKSLIADYSDYHWIVAGDIKHNKSN